MNKLKIAYFGTPQFSADLLEKIIQSDLLVEIKLVVTQPDKPIGRSQILTASPVKATALKYKIPIYDGSDIEQLPKIIKEKQIDIGLLFSFGFKQWLSKDLLASPLLKFGDTGFGFLNIHPSLLPLYRGASPIVFPILLGDKETGISLMVMDEKMDHGPLLAQEKLSTDDTDTATTLTTKLTELSFEMLSKIIPQLLITDNRLPITKQDHNFATFARFLTRDDGFISLEILKKALKGEQVELSELPNIFQWYLAHNQSSAISRQPSATDIVDRMFRALSPWPGIWTLVEINGQSKRLILKQVTKSNNQLTINKVQLEGKNEVDFESFLKVYPLGSL